MVSSIMLPLCLKHNLRVLYTRANTVQVDFKGVEFRSHPHRLSRTTGLKVKPGAFVASYNDEKVWVRDNERDGLMYTRDKGKKIAQRYITSWLPGLDMSTKAERDEMIRDRLSAFAEEHAEGGLTTDGSTTPNHNGSDTPSAYTTIMSDEELLKLYYEDDSVPDEAAATLIGEAKGQSDGMSSVSFSVVIKAKRTALELGINNPWCATAVPRVCGLSSCQHLHGRFEKAQEE